MQLSGVANQTFQEIIVLGLPTFYLKVTNTLQKDYSQLTDSQSTVGHQMSCMQFSFQQNLNIAVG